ncbi:MAG: hypothetical protein ACJ8EB_00515 [Allosphingosinicella sp.]
MTNASVQGACNFKEAVVIQRDGIALAADGLKVANDASFSDGFHAVGEVRCMRGVFGGDLDCEAATFRNPGGVAFNGRSIVVERGLLWRRLKEVRGVISLDSASVCDLVDDRASWLKADYLILDGLQYRRISGSGMSAEAQLRIAWLKHQRPSMYGAEFWPQPWEHLARVLREMGHVEDARLVAMEQQRVMRRMRVIGNRKPFPFRNRTASWMEKKRISITNRFTRSLHILYGALAGYGYRPLRTVGWMWLVWTISFALDASANSRGVFVPRNRDAPISNAAGAPVEGNSFNPAIYALDAMLPVVDLKQESDWAPIGGGPDGAGVGWARTARALGWADILFGWIASLLLVAAVGRLVQKD